MKRCAVFLLGLVLSSISMAQYRCVENGKILITDKPCANSDAPKLPQGNSPKIIDDSANSMYSTSFGNWRGQVQYQATYQGQPHPDAHAIVQMTVSIDPKGRILGSSPENGCQMKGIASPNTMPTVLNLDITLTGCTFKKLNRRLTGTLALYPAEKRAQFWIYAHPVDLFNPGWSYDIKGTMRR